MNTPASIALAALAVLAGLPLLEGQESAAAGAKFTAPHGSIFSQEEIDRAWASAVEREQRRESYIRAAADDDVIVLAPYIVEGDSSLLLARLRRELESGGKSPLRHALQISAVQRAEMLMERRAQDEFFGSGGPTSTFRQERRAGGGMLYFNPLGLPGLIRNGRFKNIFAAPPGAEE